jgi:hypothetical protein
MGKLLGLHDELCRHGQDRPWANAAHRHRTRRLSRSNPNGLDVVSIINPADATAIHRPPKYRKSDFKRIHAVVSLLPG